MIDIACECGSSFRVSDEFAGKRGKCPNCKALIRIGTPNGETAPSPHHAEQKSEESKRRNSARCGQCGAPIPSLTYSCPFCGGQVQKPVEAKVVQLEPVGIAYANQSKVESMISGAGKFMESLDPLGKLRREASQVPDSPGELVTFFSKHIGGVSELHYGPIHRQACEAALTKLRVFSLNDSRLANVISDLQRQFDLKPKAKSPFMMAGISGAVGAGLLILILAFVFFMVQRESSIRTDIQVLIEKGKFTEARMRAEDTSSGDNGKKSILETIDKAEAASRRK